MASCLEYGQKHLKDVHGVGKIYCRCIVHTDREFPAPIQDYVEYEVRTLDDHKSGHHEHYGGPPSDEQDRAWDRIVNGMSVHTPFIYLRPLYIPLD